MLSLLANAQVPTPGFEQSDCQFESSEPASNFLCGHVTVPELRSSADTRTLRLAVTVAKSFAATPSADPVVFLAGGPGSPVIADLDRYATSSTLSRVRQKRDVVFFDQRGTGLSDPKFCRALDRAILEVQISGLPGQERRERVQTAFQECREQVLAEGVDFSAYNSRSSAQDLNDIRLALGYREWNLLGVSYGSRLALYALRQMPDGIRSATLDSVMPPNAPAADRNQKFDRVLRRVFDRCSQDPECHDRFPNVEATFFRLLDEFETQPISIPIPNEMGYEANRIVVDGTALADGVRQAFYNRHFIPVFPLFVAELASGNRQVLHGLAESVLSTRNRYSYGLMYAIECYERYSRATSQAIQADQRAYPALAVWNDQSTARDRCDSWQPFRAPDTEFAAVESDIPVLAMSGEFDPVTPPSYGRLAIRTLSNGVHIEVPAMGHGAVPYSSCTQGIFLEFLDQPGRTPDSRCVNNMPPLRLETDVKAGVSLYDVAGVAGPTLQAGTVLLAFCLLIAMSPLVTWPVRRIAAHGSTPTRNRFGNTARIISLLQGIAGLVAVGATAFGIVQINRINPFLLPLGVPEKLTWILWMPWILLATSLAAAGIGIFGLRYGKNDRKDFVYVVIAAVAALFFSAWLLRATMG